MSPAQVVWIAYLIWAFGVMPVAFRLRHGRWPFAYRVPPRDAYGWIDAAYGAATAVFTVGIVLSDRVAPTANSVVAGFLVAIAAIALQTWAALAMGPSWRLGQDLHDTGVQIVRAGPFRAVGHPIYVSLVLIAAGMVLLDVATVFTIPFFVVTIVYCVIQARAENRRWRSA